MIASRVGYIKALWLSNLDVESLESDCRSNADDTEMEGITVMLSAVLSTHWVEYFILVNPENADALKPLGGKPLILKANLGAKVQRKRGKSVRAKHEEDAEAVTRRANLGAAPSH
jgi:hypothetical protein